MFHNHVWLPTFGSACVLLKLIPIKILPLLLLIAWNNRFSLSAWQLTYESIYAVANLYGILMFILLLAHALVELPKRLYHLSSIKVRSKLYFHELGAAASELEREQQEWEAEKENYSWAVIVALCGHQGVGEQQERAAAEATQQQEFPLPFGLWSLAREVVKQLRAMVYECSCVLYSHPRSGSKKHKHHIAMVLCPP